MIAPSYALWLFVWYARFLPSTVESASHNLAVVAAGLTAVATISFLLWHRKSPFRRVVTWLWKRNVSGPVWGTASQVVRSALRKDLDQLDAKITDLSNRNDGQHTENAALIAALRADFGEHMSHSEEMRTEIDSHILELKDAIIASAIPSDEVPD